VAPDLEFFSLAMKRKLTRKPPPEKIYLQKAEEKSVRKKPKN